MEQTNGENNQYNFEPYQYWRIVLVFFFLFSIKKVSKIKEGWKMNKNKSHVRQVIAENFG